MLQSITHSSTQNPYQNRVDPSLHPYAIKAKEEANSILKIDVDNVITQSTQNLRSDKKIMALQHIEKISNDGASKFILQNAITEPTQIQAVEALFTNLQSAINENSLRSMAHSKIANLKHSKESFNTAEVETNFSRSITSALQPLDIRI